jgi:phosphoserine phosphatase
MGTFTSLREAIGAQIDVLQGQQFATLDFDNTCIVNDVAEATLAHMCRNCLLRCGDLLPWGRRHCGKEYHEQVFRHYHDLLNRGDIQSASLLCAKMFAGLMRDEAEAIVSVSMDVEGNIPRLGELYGVPIWRGLTVRPVLRKLIEFLVANNVQIWIVSASPEIAVRTAMVRFGLTGQVIALRNKMDDLVLSMELEQPYSIGEGKVDCIKKFIDPGKRPLFGVGDSVHDLPMIEYADVHAVVDADDALAREARRRGWFILRSSGDRGPQVTRPRTMKPE